MSVTTRDTIRDAVAAMLESELTGSGPVAAVYGYQRSKLAGESPVQTVTSAGSERKPSGYAETGARFFLTLTTFVLHSKAEEGWTEEMAEAALDAIEGATAEALLSHQQTADWQNIQYAARSVVETVISLDGFVYRRETTPILVECEDDQA